jgi:hypothetical protein
VRKPAKTQIFYQIFVILSVLFVAALPYMILITGMEGRDDIPRDSYKFGLIRHQSSVGFQGTLVALLTPVNQNICDILICIVNVLKQQRSILYKLILWLLQKMTVIKNHLLLYEYNLKEKHHFTRAVD